MNVDGTAVAFEEGTTEGCPVVFTFKPSEFVLSTYQRTRGGSAERAIRRWASACAILLFKI